MVDVKIQVILTDLRSDGAMPIDCELTTDYQEPSELLKLKLEDLDMEIDIPLYYIGMVIGNEEHG